MHLGSQDCTATSATLGLDMHITYMNLFSFPPSPFPLSNTPGDCKRPTAAPPPQPPWG